MILQSAEGRIESCDRVAAEILGYTAQQLIGSTAFETWQTIHPDGTAFLPEDYPPIEALQSGEPRQGAVMGFYRPDGTLVWLEVSATPLFQADQEKPHAVVTRFSEIPSPTAPSQNWADDEPRFRRLADLMPHIVFAARPDGAIVYVNQFARDYTGLGDELLGKGWIACIHPDDRESAFATWLRAMQTGKAYELEGRFRRADGTYRWLLCRGLPAQDDRGQIVEWVGGCMDIDDRVRAATERQQVEAALSESNERFQTALQAVNGIVFEWNLLTGYVYRSEGLWELVGVRAEDAAPTRAWWSERIEPEDLARMEAEAVTILEQGDRYQGEYRIRHEAGHWITVWEQGYLKRNTQGELIGVIGCTTNITERKQVEAERETLLRQEQFLHKLDTRLRQRLTAEAMVEEVVNTLGEYLDVELCVWDEVDYDRRLATIAHTWQRDNIPDLTGTYDLDAFFTPQQLAIYAAGQSLVVPDVTTDPEFAPYADNYLALGVRALVSVPYIHAGRWVTCLSVGTEQPRSWRSDEVALVQEVVARLWSVIEHTRAVEELRRSEAELRQTNAILNVISESAPTLIYVKDEVGRMLVANPALLAAAGKSAEEIIGKTTIEFCEPIEEAEKMMENDRQVMQTGQVQQFEEVVEMVDGRRIFLSIKAPYCNQQGEIIGIIGVSSDISDRVQLERDRERTLQQEQAAREAAENANRIKDEFLAVVSHELRTPLNPILGWSKLLQQGRLKPEKTALALETIARNAQLQSQLIDDLLDISRILRGKLSLNILPVDLETVIAAALETVRLAAEAKGLHLETHLTPSRVMGDAGRLQQVVWNLLANAVKFTPAGGRITVVLHPVVSQAQIQVIDTGKGIKPEFLPYVFEHFRQEDGATTRKFGGLGLGLAIVRQIVELHGGTVTAASGGEDQGATFTVQMPLTNCDSQPPPIVSSADGDLSGVRIFVVDDEADSRDFVAFVLEQAGAIVSRFASGMEVLQALEQSVPDLLISDIGMPDLDGYMLMQQIQERGDRSFATIALTAFAGEFDRQQAMKAGFQRHLAKPVEPARLVKEAIALV
jgi:PAS domain S-box-containing protein